MRLARLFEARRLPGGLSLLLIVFALMLTHSDGALAAEPLLEPVIACPSTDFQKFLEIFAENEAVQRHFTKTPLIVLDIEQDAKPKPIQVMDMQDYQRIGFPILPSSQERTKRSLALRVSGISGINAEAATYHLTNNGEHLTENRTVFYRFSKDTCWRLVSIDYSMQDERARTTIDTEADSKSITSCPSRDFKNFFAIFAKDETVQRAFTNIPLPSNYVETEAWPEPISVLYVRNERQATFPVFKEQGYAISVGTSNRHAEVKVKGQDSGYLVNYLFSRGACWKLVFINDQST
jgi:hypothetical protein